MLKKINFNLIGYPFLLITIILGLYSISTGVKNINNIPVVYVQFFSIMIANLFFFIEHQFGNKKEVMSFGLYLCINISFSIFFIYESKFHLLFIIISSLTIIISIICYFTQYIIKKKTQGIIYTVILIFYFISIYYSNVGSDIFNFSIGGSLFTFCYVIKDYLLKGVIL